ncbi:AAA family ATPase [Luteimicrobium subarcticum]|uniref:MinD-like ATPase involved in chromosome partitioning or flagellar assembly n=1 Tax=Luteimicrobium subarcticum TaxID=620910 RepID=A0A2M8WWF9_9MICO|nr:hypothetical protein [Luteimicrobium subarcticum]PJI95216.1 MinD-like ATPase involved in chromosome partitioning or flagellar assembly [Luteimicrobium subarcticum]
MTGEPTAVLCAVRGADEAAVATALGTGRGTRLARRCADLPELLGAAGAGLGAVAVVSGDLSGLDRDAVAALRTVGVRVVVLVDPGLPGEEERLHALGVDRCVPRGDVTRLSDVVHDVAQGPQRALPVAPPAPVVARPRGAVVAVWGPHGAPGRTTVAVNLAAELAGVGARSRRQAGGRGTEALVVDADTYGGSVAQVLGLLDESAGLAAAARAASQGVLDEVSLAGTCPYVAPGLRVLTGITRAARWPEVSAVALDVVWEKARGVADVTVVDCGFALESDELLTYDTRAPQRNGATLSALAAADVVVVVGAADPVGVQRLVRGIGDMQALVTVPLVVVVNRVRASVCGPRPAQAVREVLARYAGVTDAHVVPDDPAACDRALLAGKAHAEHVPGSACRSALADLAVRVTGTLGSVRADRVDRSAAPATGWAPGQGSPGAPMMVPGR